MRGTLRTPHKKLIGVWRTGLARTPKGLGPVFGCIFVLFAAAAQAAGPSAETRSSSADFFLPGCKEFVAGRSTFFAGRCVGAIEILDATNSDSKTFCPPKGTHNHERARVIVDFIDAHPERKKEDFRRLAGEALTKAWPCEK
jgi:hypothetical protein